MRLVGPNGEQVGIVRVEDALRLAQEADLDLVEVAPQARPPVCKLMDFGKFKYESAIKDREARKNQAHTILKEIRLRLKIDPHDYETKKGHVERFLNAGDKVKVMIMFRGREQSRPEMGYRLLQRMAADVTEYGYVESNPKQDGRNMVMVIGPNKKKADAKAEQKDAQAEEKAARAERRREEAREATEANEKVATEAPAAPTPVLAEDEEPIFIKRATPPPAAASSAPSGAPSSYSSRPPSGGPRGDRPPSGPRGDRPAFGDRPRGDRPAYGDRPGGSSRPSFGDRPSSGPRPTGSGGPSAGGPSSRPAPSGTPRPASSGPAPAGRPAPAAGPRPVPAAGAPGPRPTPAPGPRPTPGPRPGAGPRPTPGPGPRPTPGPGPRPAPKPGSEPDAKAEGAKAPEEATKPASSEQQTAADA